MCSIAATYRMASGICSLISDKMTHRGPDSRGSFRDGEVELCHNRLSVIDPENGAQPMSLTVFGRSATIVYNGELYNTDELTAALAERGVCPRTRCDTEVLLLAYLTFGDNFVEMLNGIFAFVIWDADRRRIYAARDRLGVKPLFYVKNGESLAISSEIKGLLALPTLSPKIGIEGLWGLLLLSPISLPERTVYDDIMQLPPAGRLICDADGVRIDKYWSLKAAPAQTTDPIEAAKHLRELLFDTVRRQLRSDVPLCCFLSGGLDSSILTAIAAEIYAESGRRLSTYSFEYEGGRESFKTSLFQPNSDDSFASELAESLGTDHRVLTAPIEAVADLLPDAAYYRDLPGQADIDSSLLYYCRQVKKEHTVAISGECADEIFGGYPWFYRPEMLGNRYFPWMHDPTARLSLFRPELTRPSDAMEYLADVCKRAAENIPCLESDDPETLAYRRASVLSTDYFMTNLLERKDRMSMAASLEVRVPFADHRIIEFVYNLPKSVKFEDGVEKSLLRRAGVGLLPEKILRRKKSPYPKTHSPRFEQIVSKMLDDELKKDSFLANWLAPGAADRLRDGKDTTWMGQLMSRPQLIAWLVQLSHWSEGKEILR